MRISALAAAFVALALTGAQAGAADSPTDIIRGPYLVADVETGQIIVDHDAQRPWFPASTSKLMTLYVTLQAIRAGEISFNDQVHYSANAAAQPPSKMGFKPGSTFTLDNALKMMMVKSANDIAVAVAETVGGSVDGFAERMNAAARQLGMTRSHFVNPHGLPDEGQVSSARDMAILARALLTEFPEDRPYFAIHCHPDRRQDPAQLQPLDRPLSRRNGHEDRLHLRLRLQSRRERAARRPRADRGGVRRIWRQAPQRARGGAARRGLRYAVAAGGDGDDPLQRHLGPFLQGTASTCGPMSAGRSAGRLSQSCATNTTSSHLDELVDNGPPVRVTAYVPADYGEPGFVARLPRPRPGEGEPRRAQRLRARRRADSASPPAEAIGAATGKPARSEEVEARQ